MESNGIMEDEYEPYERETVYVNQEFPGGDGADVSKVGPKPLVPPKPNIGNNKRKTYEQIIDDPEYENEKPEIPAKNNSQEDIPLHQAPSPYTKDDPCDIQRPKAKYVDYRDQSDYLVAKTSSCKAINQRKKCSKCRVSKKCCCVVLSATAVGLAIGIGIGIGIMLVLHHLNKDEKSFVGYLPTRNVKDQLKLYITPQQETALIDIAVEPNEDGDHDKKTMKFNCSFNVQFETSILWSSYVIQNKALGKQLYSTEEVSVISRYDHSDTFFLLPKNKVSTKYTLVSVPHKKDEKNVCKPSFFIFASDAGDVYYDKIIENSKGEAITLDQLGKVEEGNITIESVRPVGVLNMYECSGKAFSHKCNRSYDQVVPDKYLGDEYLVPVFNAGKGLGESFMIITSPADNNQIEYMYGEQGTETFTLEKGESVKIRNKYPARIKCSRKCSISVIIQFHNGNHTSIAVTGVVPTKFFLTGKTYFSADFQMGEEVESDIKLILAIASGEAKDAHTKVNLDKEQMTSNWNTLTRIGFTYATLDSVERKIHSIESKGLPYMAYVIGHHKGRDFSCGFAHFIGQKDFF